MVDGVQPPRSTDAPYLGIGLGLRPVHYPEILRRASAGEEIGVDWFEALSENYMVPGGRPLRILEEVREHRPIVLHGVSLNIGSVDPLDESYLEALRSLDSRYKAVWVSDHLCWTGVDGRNLHDLIPLPYTVECVKHVADRVRQVQDFLGHRIALENVSSYLSFNADRMPEWEFLAQIAHEADCGVLLDVNNVFVSSHNHGFDPIAYIDGIPKDRVFQIHLAGHREEGPLLIDTHDHPVRSEVWDLFDHTIGRLGPVSTLIEWDDHIPSYEELLAQAELARAIIERHAAREQRHVSTRRA
jgi:uncharacterized protein (UPF0276 family)